MTYQNTLKKLDPQTLISKPKEEAITLINEAGLKSLIIKEDDKKFIASPKPLPDRIKLTIQNNIVIEARIG